MTAEADLRARILHAVRQMWPRRLGVLLFGRPASASTGPGHPDLFGIARGRFLALEIKKARAKPTPIQEQRMRELRDCGAYAWIVRTEEQACYAVYWTMKGWTRPMSDQPLDLSDWLMGEAAKPEPAGDFAATPGPMPFEPGGGRVTDPADEFKTPVPPQLEAPLFPVPEDLEEIGNEGTEPDDERAPYQEEALGKLERLDKDVRTVGDRVTLVYEKLDTYIAVLSALHGMMEKLMAMVAADDEPSADDRANAALAEVRLPGDPPRPRRQRRKKEFQIVTEAGQEAVPEPEPEPGNGTSSLGEALEAVFPND